MEDCLHASSEDLSKLVSWAHSHGTICALIPNLKHLLTEGAHGNLTAMWGCSAGHAYHWPLSATCRTGPKERACYQDSRSAGSDSLSMQGGSGTQASPGDRFPGRGGASKGKGDCGQTRDSCDFSNCSELSEADDNAEDYSGNLFDMVYESSATDEDADYEPRLQSAAECHALRKRGAPGAALGQPCRPRPEEAPGEAAVKKIKQEAQEDYYIVAHGQLGGGADGGGGAAHSPKQPCQRAALSQAALLRPSDADPASARASPSGNLAARPPRAPPLPGSQTRPPPATAQPPSRPDPLPRPPGGPPCCGPKHASNAPLPTPPRLAGHGEPSDVPPGEELAKSCGPAPLPYGDADASPACLNSNLEIISTQALGTEPKSEASDPVQLQILQTLITKISAFHQRTRQHVACPPRVGQQELYPGSGIFLSSVKLSAIHQDSRKDCMRLFHLLFEHFFSEEDLVGAVAFGKHGKVPDGKKILDRKTVDGIISYVLRCSTLDGWTSVESSKLKKACINKCRLRMSQKKKYLNLGVGNCTWMS
ncbi:uncharacterized protein KIAA1958 isoform X5 [Anguilla rostrata]|uniref:uncharacterized protein KIAA1958 isoform X5 n=1 Tax=Anguilla rostrata TaxID=7938 RepID=UPI0030CE57EE